MELIPAVDLLGGRVVRLHQGNYEAVTVYDHDPVACAARFEEQGAQRLHVVDLDGARGGERVNEDAVRAILERTQLKVQIGGGIRSREIADAWFNAGASRVVVGTAAVTHPEWVEALCAARPDGVVVAIDAREGKVAVQGWTEATEWGVVELARKVDAWGASAVLFTAIERDGTREGPDVDATSRLQGSVRADVIASGGIGSLEHVEALARAGVRAAVCGRALYAGAFAYAEAVEVLRRC